MVELNEYKHMTDCVICPADVARSLTDLMRSKSTLPLVDVMWITLSPLEFAAQAAPAVTIHVPAESDTLQMSVPVLLATFTLLGYV